MKKYYEQLEQRINKLNEALIKLEIITLGMAKIQKEVILKQERVNKEIVEVLLLIRKELKIK